MTRKRKIEQLIDGLVIEEKFAFIGCTLSLFFTVAKVYLILMEDVNISNVTSFMYFITAFGFLLSNRKTKEGWYYFFYVSFFFLSIIF